MKLPFMPLFLGDLLADTLHLSAQEFGAYMFLILHAWKHEAKVDCREARQIARISKFQWPRVSSKISQFFDTTTVSNFWIHLRVKSELEKAAEVSDKRRDAAMQMHGKHHAKASHPHLQPLIESSNGKGSEAPQEKVVLPPIANYRDPGNDYRSPPKKKSDTPLQPLPEKSKPKKKKAKNRSAGSLASALPSGALTRQPKTVPVSPSLEEIVKAKGWAK